MELVIVITDIVEKLILLTLLALSIWSVSIMIDRRRILKLEGPNDLEPLKEAVRQNLPEQIKSWCQGHPGFISGAMSEALSAKPVAESVDRAVASFTKTDRLRLEKGMAVLATLGANAPFIGLFGTVLGIIRSFAYLGSQSGSSAVMSGVSQALYATAIGLFVAIPAVVAFNVFSKKIKDIYATAESLRDLYISKLKE